MGWKICRLPSPEFHWITNFSRQGLGGLSRTIMLKGKREEENEMAEDVLLLPTGC